MKRVFACLLGLVLATGIPAAVAGAPPAGPLAPPAGTAVSKNLHPLGSSANGGAATMNTDLAFWGDLAVQGSFDGFRLLDVTAPAKPRVLADVESCGNGFAPGSEGDVAIWGNLVVRSWSIAAPIGGASCGGVAIPEGQAGLTIFDVSNPKNPVGVAFVPVTGGSRSATVVPDPANGRLLVYSAAATALRPGFDVVSIPLADPASAAVVGYEPAGRPCDDVAVVLGDANLLACAGGTGFSVFTLAEAGLGSLENPNFLYERSVPGVGAAHSVAFSADGRTIVVAPEPGAGMEARCQETSDPADRSLVFHDAETGVELGRWMLPRAQAETENCALHKLSVIPQAGRSLLVVGAYQGGFSVVDFTDPTAATEVAYADPAPLSPTALGGTWAAYWYNGRIYESDTTRGLRIWELSDGLVAQAGRLGRLNPQTAERTIQPAVAVDRNLTGSFELVGHDPLFGRGMNAAMAIHGDYAYIGNRTDGDNTTPPNCLVVCAINPGLLVVDISDPTNPHVVNEVGPPLEGNDRESSRELRVWQSQEILIVLHTNCGGNNQHNCEGGVTGPQGSINNFRFYDISGEYAANPRLILTFNQSTHEFFLWQDPNNPARALMFGGSAGNGSQIWDLSPLVNGLAPTVMRSGNHGYSTSGGAGLHSLSVSNDGSRAYYALLTGGFAVVDISDYTSGNPVQGYRLVTLNTARPTWPGPGAHSAIKFWGRDFVYVSDEVYGTATAAGHGCPWGWARMIDISDPVRPTVESQYRLPQNYSFLCPQYEPRPRTSYAAHNPTLTPNIAFTSWHSGGMQAISLEDPYYPYKLADYYPEPIDPLNMEDPRLSSDPDTGLHEKVVMWSYPIIQDGLVYIVDLRNGLYVLRYHGRFEDEVNSITFLEGNSNQGHAFCFEPVGEAPDYCD